MIVRGVVLVLLMTGLAVAQHPRAVELASASTEVLGVSLVLPAGSVREVTGIRQDEERFTVSATGSKLTIVIADQALVARDLTNASVKQLAGKQGLWSRRSTVRVVTTDAGQHAYVIDEVRPKSELLATVIFRRDDDRVLLLQYFAVGETSKSWRGVVARSVQTIASLEATKLRREVEFWWKTSLRAMDLAGPRPDGWELDSNFASTRPLLLWRLRRGSSLTGSGGMRCVIAALERRVVKWGDDPPAPLVAAPISWEAQPARMWRAEVSYEGGVLEVSCESSDQQSLKSVEELLSGLRIEPGRA